MRTSADDRSVWRPLYPILPVLASVLMLSSCVSDGGDEADGGSGSSADGQGAEEQQSDGPLASSETTGTHHRDNLQVDITSFERADDGIAVLDVTVTNLGENRVRVSDMFMDTPRRDGVRNTPDGVSLIDTQNSQRYLPLTRSGEDECLCTRWDSAFIDNEESLDFWVAFPAPPEGVGAMAVTTNVTPIFMNVPLGESTGADDRVSGEGTEEPEILDLTSYQDDLNGDSSREDTGDETSIMLSSDVLFDTNESELTSAADEALQQVAQEITDSSGNTIRIDGYTDDTGNDSINDPLSQDRAEAVEEAISELVTRDDVTFEVEGHGSSDPIATNDTEEGRQKNRRVTISFEK